MQLETQLSETALTVLQKKTLTAEANIKKVRADLAKLRKRRNLYETGQPVEDDEWQSLGQLEQDSLVLPPALQVSYTGLLFCFSTLAQSVTTLNPTLCNS